MPEQIAVLPLAGEEVREAILWKINESLKKTCHLGDSNAYTAFKAHIAIKLTLIDYGREQADNHVIDAHEDLRPAGDDSGRAESYEAVLEIPAAPPNEVRVSTGQDVPVRTTENGKPVIKKVKYAARRQPENPA